MKERVVDLYEIWQILSGSRYKILIITAVFLGAAFIYIMLASPTYESSSLLRIKQPESLLDKADSTVSDITNIERINTYAEILKSRRVIVPVIEATEKKSRRGSYPSYEKYVERITAKSFRNTEIMQLLVRADTPEAARNANQRIVDGFLACLAELSRQEQTTTREFLEDRVRETKAELTQAEDALENYEIKEKMVSPTDQMKALTDKITLIDSEKAKNQLSLAEAQAELGSVDKQLGSSGAELADNALIEQYKNTLAALELTRVGYLKKYTNEHPKMQEINAQIGQTKSKLDQEIADTVSQRTPSADPVQQSLLTDKFKSEAAISVAERKEQALAQLDSEAENEIEGLPRQEQGYIRLKRDADVAQEIYIMLDKKLEEAKIAEVMVPNEVQVIDSATLPDTPIKPRRLMIIAGALAGGLLLSSAGIIIKEFFSWNKIQTIDDINYYLKMPVLGNVPNVNKMGRTDEKYRGYALFKRLRRKLWRKK